VISKIGKASDQLQPLPAGNESFTKWKFQGTKVWPMEPSFLATKVLAYESSTIQQQNCKIFPFIYSKYFYGSDLFMVL